MEDIHTGIDQRCQEAFQFFRVLRQFRFVVLLLPLGVTQYDGEVLAYGFAHRFHNFDGETGAILD